MGSIERFEDLPVWQESRRLANLVYDLSDRGRFARDFALRDQMRRAVISIMSNVAEGFESRTQPLFIEFLGRAKASSGELRSQLYLALDREYLSREEFVEAVRSAESCSKQLSGLSQHLGRSDSCQIIKEDLAAYDTGP